MADQFDAYSDGVGVNVGPFGCALNFTLSPALPPPHGAPGNPIGTVRMSLEHLKLVAFVLRRQLLDYERNAGVQIQVPRAVLNQLQVGPEDWKQCWGESA